MKCVRVGCCDCNGVGQSMVYEASGDLCCSGFLLGLVIAVDVAGSVPQRGS